MNPVASEG